jgi:hypothetical protein
MGTPGTPLTRNQMRYRAMTPAARAKRSAERREWRRMKAAERDRVPLLLRPCHLYVITCEPTGQQYVGSTTLKLKDRWWLHIGHTNEGEDKPAPRLAAAITEHGADCFTIEHLHTYPNTRQARAAEGALIAALDLTGPRGLNVQDAGAWRHRLP